MTARSDDPEVSPASGGEIWDTWEELLLASAVKRHGTAKWDKVAMEMQSRRASAAAASVRFTPSGCRLHYRRLHRRFAAGGDDVEDPDAAAVDECVEKLRELRVAELRREVERHDLSIGSLQSKVKRLEEERERSVSGAGTPAAVKKEAEDEETRPAKGSTEDDDLAGVSGGESGRSCKESNSSDLKRPSHDAGTADGGDAVALDTDEAAAGPSVSVKREEASGESVAGSKEADEEKESSDVQSAATPSRRRAREGGGGEEAGTEASPSSSAPPASITAAETEALSAFLESVRTSKPGSVFDRRLESQDDANYRSTIRRHVDLEMMRSKLEGGGPRYASTSEFYRDLLLLCANALVFFPRGSPEHAAAAQTRALVTKHMSASLRKDQQPVTTSGKAASAPSAASKKPKADADVGSLLEKTAPIIVCRKRSSITKAAKAAEKVEKEDTEEDEEVDVKKKVATGKDNKKTRGLRTNKSRGGLARKAGPNQRAGKDSEESESAAAEGTKKSDTKAGGVAKKRNAVDFLNRMKQSSGPSTERVSLLETLKLSAAAEQKKSGKGEARKESGSGSKRGGKDTPPSRRIGRPPKRAAAPPSPPPSKRARVSGKRGGKK